MEMIGGLQIKLNILRMIMIIFIPNYYDYL